MSKLRVESFTGERLFEGINLPALGYARTQHESTPLATHVVLTSQCAQAAHLNGELT